MISNKTNFNQRPTDIEDITIGHRTAFENKQNQYRMARY